ncbi:MAG: FtsW/RodA/SpoVE family cell cycle protein, partial [Planctomycetota bacterium]
PILAEELGLAGAGLVIVLFALILWQGLAVVRRSPDLFVRLLCLSVTLMVVCQAVINLAVVTGSAPTKGIALPLVSAGGTGWLATSAMLGLVAGAERSLARARPEEDAVDQDDDAAPARPVSGRIRPSGKAAA